MIENAHIYKINNPNDKRGGNTNLDDMSIWINYARTEEERINSMLHEFGHLGQEFYIQPLHFLSGMINRSLMEGEVIASVESGLNEKGRNSCDIFKRYALITPLYSINGIDYTIYSMLTCLLGVSTMQQWKKDTSKDVDYIEEMMKQLSAKYGDKLSRDFYDKVVLCVAGSISRYMNPALVISLMDEYRDNIRKVENQNITTQNIEQERDMYGKKKTTISSESDDYDITCYRFERCNEILQMCQLMDSDPKRYEELKNDGYRQILLLKSKRNIDLGQEVYELVEIFKKMMQQFISNVNSIDELDNIKQLIQKFSSGFPIGSDIEKIVLSEISKKMYGDSNESTIEYEEAGVVENNGERDSQVVEQSNNDELKAVSVEEFKKFWLYDVFG